MSKQKEAALKRKAQREADKKQFPGAAYNVGIGGLQVFIDDGERNYIRFRTNDLTIFEPSRIGGDHGWVECSIWIGDIQEFSSLIASMTARLNAMIDDANANIARTKVTELQKHYLRDRA